MKWLITTVIIISSMALYGQKIEIVERSSTQRSVDSENEKLIRFTPDSTDIYSIKVVGPGGMKMTTPIRKEEISNNSFSEFTLNTRYWKRGTYFIIAENKRGTLATTRLTIR